MRRPAKLRKCEPGDQGLTLKGFTQELNRKMVGPGRLARLENLSLEAKSLRLRGFNEEFKGTKEGLVESVHIGKSGQGILHCNCLRMSRCDNVRYRIERNAVPLRRLARFRKCESGGQVPQNKRLY